MGPVGAASGGRAFTVRPQAQSRGMALGPSTGPLSNPGPTSSIIYLTLDMSSPRTKLITAKRFINLSDRRIDSFNNRSN